MKMSEICQGVIDGTIEIDCCGHRCNDPKEKLLDWFSHTTEYANGNGDADTRACYQCELDNEPGPDQPLSLFQMENYCFSCGKRLKLIYRGGKLELRHWYDPDAPNKRWGKGNHAIQESQCEFENDPPYGGEIEIKSSLVIGCFFVGLEDDCPEDEQYGDKYDLNCHGGRMARSKWKLENQKVAYGQMTNTSIGIYVNTEGTSVIIGPAWLDDTRIQDHELVGTVSLSVWRWEASDKDNLGEHYQKTIDAEHVDNPVDIKVVPGTWKYTHYFRSGEHSDEIYARLEKV